MGDLSAEPSMEEILSSIKRIIAEEGDGGAARARRPSRAAPAPSIAPPPLPDEDGDEVLELSDPMPTASIRSEQARSEQARSQQAGPEQARSEPPRAAAPLAPVAEPSTPAEPIVSQSAAAASRGSLEALSRRVVVKPEPGSDGTLESLVREMLRPMLREWLDTHLPDMVEEMVGREIARIAGQQA